MKLYRRWMLGRDVEEVLEIERQAFGVHAWQAEDIISFGNGKGVCWVAEYREIIAGWVAYKKHRSHIRIHSIAVLRDFRRQGVGRALLEHLLGHIGVSRNKILARVVDWNLAGHLFFTKCGFDCLGVVPTDYNVGPVDAYEFEWKANKEVGCG